MYEIVIDNQKPKLYSSDKVWNLQEYFAIRNKTTNKNDYVFKVVRYTNRELLDRFKKNKKPRLRFENKISHYKEKELPINPYIYGYFIGDGSKNSAKIAIWSEIIDEMEKIFLSYDYKISRKYKLKNANCYEVFLTNIKTNKSLYVELKENGLLEQKCIPKEYIYNSIDNRQELIKGLMDSDGTISKDGNCDFKQKEKDTINKLSKSLWSLGIKNSVNVGTTYDKRLNKKYSFYRLRFSPFSFNPFNLQYKKDRVKEKYKEQVKYSYIQNIKEKR